jgi:hypothetical protein
MGDTVIITEDEPKPVEPAVIVVTPQPAAKTEKVVTEKTTVIETKPTSPTGM